MSTQVGEILADNGSRAALITKAVWATQADIWFDSLEEGYRFTAEDLTDAIGFPDTFYPNSNNAVGAKIRSWSQKHTVTRIGFQKTSRSVSHARMIALWEQL